MRRLTKAEEEIMLIIWKIGEGMVRDVIGELEKDTPYTTVSTVIRIIKRKVLPAIRLLVHSPLFSACK